MSTLEECAHAAKRFPQESPADAQPQVRRRLRGLVWKLVEAGTELLQGVFMGASMMAAQVDLPTAGEDHSDGGSNSTAVTCLTAA